MSKQSKWYLSAVMVCSLFVPAVSRATEYYVDASAGNDSNSGRSTASPWRTVGKVNSSSFAPGDRILFQRGQTWREQLIVPSSGASGNPIVYGAYGSGSRPAIKGSALVTGWTSAGGSVWRASLGSAPNQVFFGGARGTKAGGTSGVNAARKWYWSSGTLYVYSGSDPDGGTTIEASVRPSTRSYGIVHIQNRSYVTIQSLDVAQSASFGLYIKPSGQYITADDCDVHDSLDGGLVAPSSNGVAASKITVLNCLVHHNNGGYKEGAPGVATYHEGLTMERVDGFTIRGTKVYRNYMEGSNFKRGARNGVLEYCELYANDLINQYIEGATNIQVRYNRIYDCTYNAGLEFGLETDAYSNDNIKIYGNLFYGNSGGVSFWSAGVSSQTKNIQIYNNTFYNNWEAVRWKGGATDNYSGTNSIKDNLFWQSSSSNRAIWDYTSGQQAIGRTSIAYNAFQQGAATATTGSNARVITDPYFVSASSRDFHLQSGSPCINVGTNVGLTADMDGTSIPQGSAPDIGADEYGSGGTTPTTYTLTTSATNGTISRAPNQTSYTSGQSVTLTATASSGYTFSGWSGDLTGTTNPATLVMNSNKSVTANFTSSGSTGGTGSTLKKVGNTTVFAAITTIQNRRAAPYTMPEAGKLQSISIYHQAGSGQMVLAVYADSSGKPGSRLGVTNSTTVSGTQGWQTVTLQSPVSVSAGQKIWLAWVFEKNPGMRAASGTPGRAESGATWSGGMPTTFGTSTIASYIYSVYANYSPSSTSTTSYTLTTSATNGTITRAPNQTSYTSGTTVALTATPNSGYTFSGWSGSLTGTTNPATLVMNANKSVTANFTSSGGTTLKKIGNTTVFSGSTTLSNRRAVPYTMPAAGRLQSITIYHEAGSGQMLLGVYADNSGKPGNRLGVTNAVTVSSSAGWQTAALQSPVSVSSGQKIWLAWVFQSNPGIRATAGTPGRADSTATWSGGMPTTFGTSTLSNYIYSIYANYSPASTTTLAVAQSLAVSSDSLATTEATADTADLAAPTWPDTQTLLQAGLGLLGDVSPLPSAPAPVDEPTVKKPGKVDTAKRPAESGKSAQQGLTSPSGDVSLPAEQAGLPQGKPATAADRQGNTWVVWQAGEVGQRQVYAAQLAGDTQAWSPAVQISQGEGDHCEPALAIDATGTLYVAWQEGLAERWSIRLSLSPDGSSWSAPQPLADANDNQTQPSLAAGSQPGSPVAVVWQQGPADGQEIFVAASSDQFQSATVAQVSSASQAPAEPVAGVDGQGTIYVLWTDARDGARDIYGAASTSASWTNVPLTAGTSNHSQPALAVGADGVLYLAWVDDIGGDPDIFYAASAGLPSRPVVASDIVEDPSQSAQEAPALAVVGTEDAERVYVGWQDSRDTARDGATSLYLVDVSAGSKGANMPIGPGRTKGNQSDLALGVGPQGRPYLVWTQAGEAGTQIRYSQASDNIPASAGNSAPEKK